MPLPVDLVLLILSPEEPAILCLFGHSRARRGACATAMSQRGCGSADGRRGDPCRADERCLAR